LTTWERHFHTVDLETLEKALGHPCRFLLESRLQIKLREDATEDPNRECFALDSLQRHLLGQKMIEGRLGQETPAEMLAKARAAGWLPHGPPGRIHFETILAETEDITAAVETLQTGTPSRPLIIEARLAPYTITGRLTSIFPAGQVLYRFGKARGPDLIVAWLRHLLWCRLTGDPRTCTTTLVASDGQRRIRGVDPQAPYLEELLALYHRAGHEVVPLLPRSSWTYAVLRFEKGLRTAKALERVRGLWERPFGWPGESADPYLRLCFRDHHPLDEVFATTAETVFGPILRHTEIFDHG
jgi:exodeoxyribonuclease V gamma subunit